MTPKDYVRVCAECRAVFRAKSPNAVYCPDCAESRRRMREAQRREAERDWIPEDRECAVCGETFTAERFGERVCPECEALRSTRFGAVRRFHNCGKATTQYRCSACWAKIRRKMRIGDEEDDE